MLSPRQVTRQHVCGSERVQDSDSVGYYSNTRGLSRVPVWYMLIPSLGVKNVRMNDHGKLCTCTGKQLNLA